MNKRTIYRDPTTVNESAPTDEVGQCSSYYHPTYGWWTVRYVQFLNAIAYLAGQCVQFCDTARGTVTNDVTGGATATIGIAAGIVVYGAHTQNYYGYVLAQGYYPTVRDNGDDDIALGDQIIVSTTDGVCDSATTFKGVHLGFATAADSDANDNVAALIDALVD